jgi:hypothetical protein
MAKWIIAAIIGFLVILAIENKTGFQGLPSWVLNGVVFGLLGLWFVWNFAVLSREQRARRNPNGPQTVYWRNRGDGRPGFWMTDRPGMQSETLGSWGYKEYGGAISEGDGWHMYCKECVEDLPTVAPHREEAMSRLLAHWQEVHGKRLRLRKRRVIGY